MTFSEHQTEHPSYLICTLNVLSESLIRVDAGIKIYKAFRLRYTIMVHQNTIYGID